MGEMTKKPTVPAIRFKGFTDTWEQRKLGDVGETYTGLSGKTKADFGHGQARFITYMNVFSNPISNPEMTEPIEIDPKQNEVEVGDVFFTTSSETPEEVGMSSVLLEKRGKIYLNSFCFGFRPTEKIDSYYLAYMLRSESAREKIILLAQGISRYNISKNKVMEIAVSLPSLDEQKLIGQYFRQLDNLITLHQRKLDKLHKVKRSLLERMFPRNGANVPEIRFSGFTDAWEQCELGAIIQAVQELTSDFENYPLYSLTIENGVTPKTERYERSFLITKETDLFKIVPEQCFVSNPMNLRFGAIGFNDSGKKVSVSGYYDVFSIDRGECSNFWCVYLKTANSLKRFDDVAIGSLIEKRRVHFSQLTEMSFPAPNMNEKKKLGEFFERLERLITLHQRKLDKLRQIKRSMLEKMFV